MKLRTAHRRMCIVGALLAPALLVSALLVSCSAGGLFRKATPTPAPVTLKVGTIPFLSNTVIQIGIDEGYFAAQGLTVEKVSYTLSSDMLVAVETGALDACTPPLIPALFNLLGGGGRVRIALPLTVHTDRGCVTAGYIARKEDAESGRFADPKDWDGATFVGTRGGLQATGGYVLSRILQPAGLTVADLLTEVADPAVQEEVVRSGQADLFWAVEPWVTRALAVGDMALLHSVEEVTPGLQGSAIVFGARLLDNPDIGTRFAVAFLQAARQFSQGATPRNVEIAAAFTGLEPDLLSSICWTYTPVDGAIDARSLTDYQTWLKEEGLIDRVVPLEECVDSSFAEEAVRRLQEMER